MDNYRCEKGKENFVGMNPLGVFYCDQGDLSMFFRLIKKNRFSILEKPNKECQKHILDLDEKEKEIPEDVVIEICETVKEIFDKFFHVIICQREGSFGIHLHFLGCLVTDEIYKDLTKYLKKKFPIVDTSPFNHFIPGTGKPGKYPYLPVAGHLKMMKSYSKNKKKYLLTKNLTGYETDKWEFYTPKIELKPDKEILKSVIVTQKSGDKLDDIITYCEEIYQTNPECELWDDYCKWIKVGFVLSYFGRQDLWQRFSNLSYKYDEDFCDKKWNELKKSTKYGNPRIIINMLKRVMNLIHLLF